MTTLSTSTSTSTRRRCKWRRMPLTKESLAGMLDHELVRAFDPSKALH
jgi:hypothetical protein